MTASASDSRSDLEALQRSGRGKFLGLGAVIAVTMGAAAWSFWGGKEGIGDPELAHKVLVVTRGSGGGYSAFLKEMGFEAAEGTLPGWEQKAKEEVPDLTDEGIEAVFKLADRYGYGFIVFEEPHAVDFSALELEDAAAFEEHVQFAVVSVGDFSFPHELTTNPVPSTILRDPSVPILEALFAQSRLAKALPHAEGASLNDLKVQEQLKPAIERFARVAEAPTVVARITRKLSELLVDGEKLPMKPQLVGTSFDSGRAYPVGDQVLSAIRGFDVITRDAITADIELRAEEKLYVGPVDAVPEERIACDLGLRHSAAAFDDLQVIASDDDDAWAMRVSRSEPWRLFTTGGGAQNCGLKQLGTIAHDPSLELAGLRPHASGKVARPLGREGIEVATVEPWTATTIEAPAGMWIESVSWVDVQTIAAVGHDENMGAKGIVLVRIDAPDRQLWIDGTSFDEGVYGGRVDTVRPVPGASSLIVAAGSPSLYRLDLPSSWTELFEAPPVIEGWKAPRGAAGPKLSPLDPSRLEVSRLTSDGRVDHPVVSRDGSTVAFELRGSMTEASDANFDNEIAIVPAAGGEVVPLTQNVLTDHSPRLTRDGRFVVFATRFDIPRTKWRITVPRRVPTGR